MAAPCRSVPSIASLVRRHPSPGAVRKEQYPHRFRHTVVRGRKTFFEKVMTRGSIDKFSVIPIEK
jgi:hypothetical protein